MTKKQVTIKKTETIQEFLARGGKITLCPEGIKDTREKVNVKSTTVGPAILMTLEEADHYYGEKRKSNKPIKEQNKPNLNLDCLPEEFRKKLGL